MRIPCPLCGERGSEEFTYRGDATLRRPVPDAPAEAWHAYVYLRDNPPDRHADLWWHGAGCQSWLRVDRDVRTHEVFAVRVVRDAAAPDGAEA